MIRIQNDFITSPPPDKDEYESQNIRQPRTIRVVEGKENPVQAERQSFGGSSWGAVEFRISEMEGLLIIRFLGRYDQEWIRELRTYGDCQYDKRRKEWLLPWSKMSCDSLADYFAGKGIAVNVTKKVVNEELKLERKNTGDEIRSRVLGKKALDGLDLMVWFLDENRYSPRTRESYLAMLEFFFRYFSPKEPQEITEEEISRFLYDFIIRLGYSAAYQNQMVSAIKTYYTISGKGKVDPEIFERPRRSRALPKVFSKEEVSMILNSPKNLKHKLILWIIYSCGLRRSEVTNITLTDLDRERGILHIREGKGRVDRIVPVPVKIWDKIDEYSRGYRPREYLFEGQTGGRYSSESVYHIFKDALLKTGIKKDVGVHSLRHSYATHLHENGLDIRYIQELLGHKSTRTTEIYTHVSRRNLVAVRSPIEDLDLK
jgi:site-specific recombinase XerD